MSPERNGIEEMKSNFRNCGGCGTEAEKVGGSRWIRMVGY
jgi:hypothetical protein